MASLIHSTITPERHDSIVRFAAATLLSLSISSVVVRLVWIRHPLRSLFGADDLATIIGMVRGSSRCILSTLGTDSHVRADSCIGAERLSTVGIAVRLCTEEQRSRQ